MRTIIYVDGFNLVFPVGSATASAQAERQMLAERLLNPANTIVGVRYYTARVSGRIDVGAPARQQVYLDALRTM